MPPSLCHYSLEWEDWRRNYKVGKDGLLGYRDMMKWEWVMCLGREVVVWLVKFKGMCRSQTAGSPKSLRSAQIQVKKQKSWWLWLCWMHFWSWKVVCKHDLSTTSVSCWIILTESGSRISDFGWWSETECHYWYNHHRKVKILWVSSSCVE